MNNVEWIKLSKGAAALVDGEDFEWLNQWVWTLHSEGYAYRTDYTSGKIVFMHRLVNKTPDNLHTDHINRIRLDNRKANLRSVTQKDNNGNGSGNRNKRVYHGLPVRVTFDKNRGKYLARAREGGSKRFATLEEASEYAR